MISALPGSAICTIPRSQKTSTAQWVVSRLISLLQKTEAITPFSKRISASAPGSVAGSRPPSPA